MTRTSGNFLLVAVMAMAFTGCVASVQPLSDAKTSMPDLRLLGDWEYQEDKRSEKVRLSVIAKKDAPKVLQVTADDGKDKEIADLYLTKIGDDYFASVENVENDGSKRYLIAKYALQKDGTVKIWVPETDVFVKAVEEKKLKGKVSQPKLFKDVVLEDSPENIRDFLKQQGAKCFGKETTVVIQRIAKAAPAKTGK